MKLYKYLGIIWRAYIRAYDKTMDEIMELEEPYCSMLLYNIFFEELK